MTLECVLAQLPPLVFINFVSKEFFRSAIDTRPGDSYENNKLKVLLGRVLVAAVLGQVLHLVLLGPERVVMVVVTRRRLVALIAAVFLMTFVFHRSLALDTQKPHTILSLAGTSVRLHRCLRFFRIKTISNVLWKQRKVISAATAWFFYSPRRFPVAMLRTHRDSREFTTKIERRK